MNRLVNSESDPNAHMNLVYGKDGISSQGEKEGLFKQMVWKQLGKLLKSIFLS